RDICNSCPWVRGVMMSLTLPSSTLRRSLLHRLHTARNTVLITDFDDHLMSTGLSTRPSTCSVPTYLGTRHALDIHFGQKCSAVIGLSVGPQNIHTFVVISRRPRTCIQ